MESLLYHFVLIPGVFLLGWLSNSVKLASFRAKVISKESMKSNE